MYKTHIQRFLYYTLYKNTSICLSEKKKKKLQFVFPSVFLSTK